MNINSNPARLFQALTAACVLTCGGGFPGKACDVAMAGELVEALSTIQLVDISDNGQVCKKGTLSVAAIEGLSDGLEAAEVMLVIVPSCEGTVARLSAFLNYGDSISSPGDLDPDTGTFKHGVVLSREGCRCLIDISSDFAGLLEDGITSFEVIIDETFMDGEGISLADLTYMHVLVRGMRSN